MENITQTKLINSLIDAVSHFYELKQRGDTSNQKYIKGFCEGLAYTLVEIKALSSDEAKRILKGLGKKLEEIEPVVEKESVDEKKESKIEKENLPNSDLLDVDKKSNQDEKIETIPLKIEEKELEKEDLERPTIFRKKIEK